jgi:hypothetical protein
MAVRSEVVIAARPKLITTGAVASFCFTVDVITTAVFGTTNYFITYVPTSAKVIGEVTTRSELNGWRPM